MQLLVLGATNPSHAAAYTKLYEGCLLWSANWIFK